MQIAAPVTRPVRRLLPAGSLGTRPLLLALLALGVVAGVGIVAYMRFFAAAPPAPTGQIVLVKPGNVAATAEKIVASQSLFRAGFATDLVVFVIEVALAAVLYVLFRPVSRTLALVMAFARLAMVTILGLNLLNMFTALQLLTSPEYATAFEKGQLQALAFVFLNAQHYGYALGMVFFGLHLGVLGFLVYRSRFLPRILGILMVVSALGYLADSFTKFLLPESADTLAVVVVVTALIGELPLTLWLPVKGVNVERWRQRALASPTREIDGRALSSVR